LSSFALYKKEVTKKGLDEPVFEVISFVSISPLKQLSLRYLFWGVYG